MSARFKPYPRYHDSDVKWLGQLPEGWKVQRLKRITDANFSGVDKHTKEGECPVHLCNYVDVYYHDHITTQIDFMAATATPDEVRRFTIRKGDVLVTKDSEDWEDIAVPALVSEELEDVLCGYHLAHVRVKTSLMDGGYLFRAFSARGVNDQFRVEASGVTRFGLGKYGLDNALFPVPPLPEQRTIAAFLDRKTARIDVLIEKKECQIELLQEKRAALISHAVTKGLTGLDSRGDAEDAEWKRPAKMKDSGIEWLGEVPDHWKLYRAKVLFRQIDERSTTGKEELLTVSHITGVTRRSEKNVNMFMAESLQGYKKCESGDLVINTMWAWMGALGIASETGIVSPSYNVYRLRDSRSETWFYDYLFRTERFLAEVICHSKGVWSSRLRLYPEGFFEIRLPCPPLDEQRKIITAIRSETGHYNALQKKIEKSIEKLREYRTALISAAVTGKIDVREEAGMKFSSIPIRNNQLAQINALMRTPQMEMEKQIESVIKQYKKIQMIPDQFAHIANVSAITVASQSLLAASKAIQSDTSHLDAMINIHKSWKESLLPTRIMTAEIQKSVKLALSTSSHIASIADNFRTQIDFTKFHAAFGIEEAFVSSISETLASTESSFSQLTGSLVELPKLAEMPALVMPGASREMFLSEYAISELIPNEEQTEEDSYFEVIADIREETSAAQYLIQKVNPELAVAYQGAKDAFKNKNADYPRHVLSSLREMWNNLIWILAPNDGLIPWIGDNAEYTHEGKPTRRARIDYICRAFNHEPLSDFLYQDTKAFVEMINFFNRVHQLDSGLTDAQLKALILRSDSWLMYIIQIYEESR